jgi:hypothetical protein
MYRNRSAMRRWRFHRTALGVAVLALAVLPRFAESAETNAPPLPIGRLDETNSQEILRVYLQLQEQLHATQLAVEQNRKEAREAAEHNAEILASRLQSIEQALATQRARELEAMQSSNRVMLIVAGSFACVGFLVMLAGAYFQWRTAQSLTGLSGFYPQRELGPGPIRAALGPGEAQLLPPGTAEQSNLRLLGALEQLEKRIHELEHTSRPPLQEGSPQQEEHSGADTRSNGSHSEGDHAAPHAPAPVTTRIDMLLGKGLSMLNLDQVEAAMKCFDEVLELDPDNAEALVRKGIALERLQMLTEAVTCYDRAIAADGSLTVAYLHKGGVFNRMERYDEALACYEQALRTQEKRES